MLCIYYVYYGILIIPIGRLALNEQGNKPLTIIAIIVFHYSN